MLIKSRLSELADDALELLTSDRAKTATLFSAAYHFATCREMELATECYELGRRFMDEGDYSPWIAARIAGLLGTGSIERALKALVVPERYASMSQDDFVEVHMRYAVDLAHAGQLEGAHSVIEKVHNWQTQDETWQRIADTWGDRPIPKIGDGASLAAVAKFSSALCASDRGGIGLKLAQKVLVESQSQPNPNRVIIQSSLIPGLLAVGDRETAAEVARGCIIESLQFRRDIFFNVLGRAAKFISSLDGGAALAQIWDCIRQMNGWWPIESSRSARQL